MLPIARAAEGLTRIRHYGWMANRCRRQAAALARKLLEVEPVPPEPAGGDDAYERRCPICGGIIEMVEMIVPPQVARRCPSRKRAPDTS